MQVVSDSVNKVSVKFAGSGINALEFLHIIVSGITQESLSFILGQKTRDLTGGQDHVNEFQEFFLFDFRVSQNETAISTEPTSDFEIFFYVFLEILLTIVFSQFDLFVVHTLNES